ncbi:MAG: carbohydrate kinase [Clostridia bacterium]|nr:carbohydrate kinase [Clostridia bacterium]
MFDIVSIGEALIDFTPMGVTENGTPLFGANAGGGPANLAAAVTRLGGTAAFLGQVGDDYFGRRLEEVLTAEGIDTAGLVRSGQYKTSLAFIHLSRDGERDFSFYRDPGADELLGRDAVRFDLIARSRCLHFSSVVFTHDTAREATLAAASYARARGVPVSYDPNWRPMLWRDEHAGRAALRLGIPTADIVKATPEELELLTGESDESAAAGRLFDQGVRILLVTRGDAGSTVSTKAGSVDAPGVRVQAVDTTGAGDACFGAFLLELVRSMENTRTGTGSLGDIPLAELGRIARFANAAAALSVSRHGGIPSMPTRHELDAFLAEHVGDLYR